MTRYVTGPLARCPLSGSLFVTNVSRFILEKSLFTLGHRELFRIIYRNKTGFSTTASVWALPSWDCLPVYCTDYCVPYFSDLRPTLRERSYFAQKHKNMTYIWKYIKSVLFAYTCDLRFEKTHFEAASTIKAGNVVTFFVVYNFFLKKTYPRHEFFVFFKYV